VKISLTGGVGARPGPGQVGIEIFDITGRLVADLPVTNCDLKNSQFVPTPVIWQPDNSVGSGVYFVRVATSDISVLKKVIYLK
jgi:hypothetical protein